MNCEILSVGTEILLGEIANTDAQMISQGLSERGINVFYHTVCGDNPSRLLDCVEAARSRADLIITTGGLGPTCDDLTKETLAQAFGKKIVPFEAEIEKLKAKMGDRMTPNNLKQAHLPEGCTVLDNAWGTAPGCAFESDGCTVIMLPGPPRECRPMFYERAIPYLRDKFGGVIHSSYLKFYGIGESAMEDKLRFLMDSRNPTVAPYAKEGEMRLRVGALANSEDEGEQMCQELIEKVKSSPVGKYIYAIDSENIESLLVATLKEKGLTISVAESCTGGYLGKRITDVPGASSVFMGGFITYSDDMKIKLLGVNKETLLKHTAVSAEVAEEMAQGTRTITGTDLAISLTGEAGPTAYTDKSVGTVFVGISTHDETYSIKLSISSRRDREYIRKVAGSQAMREIIKKINY